jgi:hypothetical protein
MNRKKTKIMKNFLSLLHINPWIKSILIFTFLGLASTVTSQPAFASPHGSVVSLCFLRSTSQSERLELMKFSFILFADHPAFKSVISATPDQKDEINEKVAIILNRLVTENCRLELQEALVHEGDAIFKESFTTLLEMSGKEASETLTSNPKYLEGFMKHINRLSNDFLPPIPRVTDLPPEVSKVAMEAPSQITINKIVGKYRVVLDPKVLDDAKKEGVKSVTGMWIIKSDGTFESSLKAVSIRDEVQVITMTGKITIEYGKVVSQVATVNGEKPPQTAPKQLYTLSSDGKELQADGQPVKLIKQ